MDTIYWYMQGGANLQPGANCAYEHGFIVSSSIHKFNAAKNGSKRVAFLIQLSVYTLSRCSCSGTKTYIIHVLDR